MEREQSRAATSHATSQRSAKSDHGKHTALPKHHTHNPAILIKMLARAAIRTSQAAGRRAFHASPARLSSPYHYPEGPYSNLPFNPRSKFFGVGYWGLAIVGFLAPFGIGAWQTYKPK